MNKHKLGIISLILCAVSALAFSVAQFANDVLQAVLITIALGTSTVFVCLAPTYLHLLLTNGKEFPKATKGFILTTLGNLALSVLAWTVLLTQIVKSEALNIIIFAVALASSVWFASYLITTFHYAGEVGRDYLSHIRVYVINNIIFGLAFSGIGLYFAVLGSWNALVAVMIFVTYIPASVVSLIGAFVFYLHARKKAQA